AVSLRIDLHKSLNLFITSIFIMVLVCLTVFYLFINKSKLVMYIILIYLFPTLGEMYSLALPHIEWIKLPYNIEAKLFTLVYFLSQFVLIFLLKHLAGKQKIPYINSILVLYGITFIVLVLLPIEYLDIASAYLIGFYALWIIYCFIYL